MEHKNGGVRKHSCYYPGQRQSKNGRRFLGGYLTFLAEPYRVQPKKADKSIVLTKPEGRG